MTQLTLPHTGQRPASFPLFAASCIELVTNPWEPSRCLSKPWSVKNLNWHFWQLSGGRLYIIFGWICKEIEFRCHLTSLTGRSISLPALLTLTLCIHCIWFLSWSKSLMYPSHISQITNEALPPPADDWPGLIPVAAAAGFASCAAAACSWKDDKAVDGCLGSGVIDMLGCCCLDDLGPGCWNDNIQLIKSNDRTRC